MLGRNSGKFIRCCPRSVSKVRYIASTQRLCVPTAEPSSPYKHGKFRSNAAELVTKQPVIEVEGHVAVCDGGSGALGHPLEYIQLDTVKDEPQICKYCGLRYKKKHGSHHH
mmetsp:Transcript_31021/g.23070  ORF Transcript_31021/g.23070 Transcript_31021/m.23070 type:complete len:111 (-) Transcript_31021:21-353(-)